jgi:Cu/Ag efflux pump CusA
VLIKRYQWLDREQAEALAPELALRGARERLEPVLASALAVLASVLPFALVGDLPGLEVVRPMAAVVVGGLITSTLLSLFAIPVLYLRFGSSPEPILESAPFAPINYAGATSAAD